MTNSIPTLSENQITILDYEPFRAKYAKEHPSSVPRKPHVALTPRWLKLVILFVFFAAAMVSGAHTVTAVARTIAVKEGTLISLEWHRQIISLLGFAMVELVMFVSAYMLILHPDNKRLLYALLIISLSVAIAGNLDSTFEALSTSANMNALTIFVGLAVGIGAPLTTLLTGELFSRIKVQDDKLTSEALKVFRDELKQFDANVLSAFNKYSREQNERTANEQREQKALHSAHSFALHSGTSERTNEYIPANRSERATNAANGYTKNMSAKELAAAYIRSARVSNPSVMTMTTDDLHALVVGNGYRVGRTAVHEARKIVASEPLPTEEDTKEALAVETNE